MNVLYFWVSVWVSFLPCIVSWSCQNSIILNPQNDPYRVQGMSWFGFETQDFVINGLWQHPMTFYLDILQTNQINTLRVPFSAEWVLYNGEKYPWNGLLSGDSSQQNKQSFQILDTLFDECEKRNISILLDLHRLHKEYISELWYSPTDRKYTSDTFIQTWKIMLDRYHDRPNLFGIDLLNEPHGSATWGKGIPSTDWNQFVEYSVPLIVNGYPESFAILIEGIEWGHTFRDARQSPLRWENSSLASRVMYSPHTYGRSVVPSASTDPASLYWQWDQDFGFLSTEQGHCVIIGEWGGQTSIDQAWMSILAQYVKERKIPNNFFWSLGPNSGDVQGFLLDDWTSVDGWKQNLLHSMYQMPYSPFS